MRHDHALIANIKFTVALALAMFMGWLAPGAFAAAEPSEYARKIFDGYYDGMCKGHANVPAYVNEVYRALDDFPAIYQKVTGRDAGGPEHIKLKLADGEISVPGAEESENAGLTDYVGGDVMVTLRVPVHIGRLRRVYDLVIHEMTHAVQRRDVGNGKDWDANWPVWFREGIAVYVSAEVQFKIDHVGLETLYNKNADPVTSLVGLQETRTASNYAEWGVAVQALDETKPGQLGALIQWLYDKMGLAEGIQSIYGIAWQDFVTRAQTAATARFRAAFPEQAVTDFLGVQDALKQRDAAKMKALLEGIRNNADWAKTPMHGTVLWELSLTHGVFKELDKSIECLQLLMQEGPDDPQYENCFYNTYRILQMQNKFDDAKAGYLKVMADFPAKPKLVKNCQDRLAEIEKAQAK